MRQIRPIDNRAAVHIDLEWVNITPVLTDFRFNEFPVSHINAVDIGPVARLRTLRRACFDLVEEFMNGLSRVRRATILYPVDGPGRRTPLERIEFMIADGRRIGRQGLDLFRVSLDCAFMNAALVVHFHEVFAPIALRAIQSLDLHGEIDLLHNQGVARDSRLHLRRAGR